MTRPEAIQKILWNSGGMSDWCGAWSMVGLPANRENDIKSVVAVSGPPEKYTDEELERLAAFSAERTQRYDKIFKVRRGANLICVDKLGGAWMRKRLSWTHGPMFSPTLAEALAVFARD